MAIKAQLQKKMDFVEDLKQNLQEAELAVLADYRGIDVAEITKLRSDLRAAGVKFKVAKNTLTKRAANEVGINSLDPFLEGPTVIAFSKDPVAVAKILTNFAKDKKKLDIKAGLLNGQLVSTENIKDLADLPSREELLGRVLSGMMGPLNGMVNVLQGPIRNFVYVLEAYRKQQAGEA